MIVIAFGADNEVGLAYRQVGESRTVSLHDLRSGPCLRIIGIGADLILRCGSGPRDIDRLTILGNLYIRRLRARLVIRDIDVNYRLGKHRIARKTTKTRFSISCVSASQ